MVLLVLLDGESRIVGFCTLEISVEGLTVTLNVCRHLHDVSSLRLRLTRLDECNLYTHPFCPHRFSATKPAFLRLPMLEREHIQLPQTASDVPTGRTIHYALPRWAVHGQKERCSPIVA